MIKRVYRPIWEWEEIDANMWGSVDNRRRFLNAAIEFTGDHKRYGRFMLRVIREWPASCENALTDLSSNRRAWIGHAASALSLGCPEDITREAWAHLTKQQQDRANAQADNAIRIWEKAYAEGKNIELHRYMEDSLL